jgi:two-component system nitrate/nitrite response regulator NarL
LSHRRERVASSASCRVGEAENGREALDIIRRDEPAVAFVDYQMPEMDGVAVVHAAARDHLPTRVLLLSAVTDSAVVIRALVAEATRQRRLE